MKQKVKVGISGLGNHAVQHHLAKLLKMRDVEIVGAFDPDISKFDKANEILGTNLKFFNSYQELCFASDAVIICLPDRVRFSQLMIAVKEYGCYSDPVGEDLKFQQPIGKIPNSNHDVAYKALNRNFIDSICPNFGGRFKSGLFFVICVKQILDKII